MIKPHHPQNRWERIKLREKKESKQTAIRRADEVRKKLAIEAAKEQEARHEIEQIGNWITADGIER